MRRTFFLIHKWLAIPFGVFISIMCFTGALLVFKSEIASALGCDANDMPFFKGVTQLHRWLFIVPDNPHGGFSFGRLIMGVSAIATTLILVSGVVLWWPKSRKMLNSRLKVSVRKGWSRFVYDSHVSLGIYACVFLLLMSLTGPVWSFRWYRKGAVAAIGASEGARSPEQGRGGAAGFAAEQGRNAGRGGNSRGGRPADAGAEAKPGRAEHGNAKAENGRGKAENVHAKPENVRGKGGNSAQKTFIYLHTGKWAGLLSRIIYCLAAVIGGFLPLSGYYLWLKKRSRA